MAATGSVFTKGRGDKAIRVVVLCKLMEVAQTRSNDADILTRVIQLNGDGFSVAAARSLLKLRFSREDRERMHELAVRNQAGKLSEADLQELESFLRVGRLVDLLAAKARLILKQHGLSD